MIVLSWNCQGIEATWTVRALREMIRSHNPDMVFLIETKCNSQRMDNIKRSINMDGLAVNSKSRGGGLALLWRKSLTTTIQSFSQHHIDSSVQESSQPHAWRFTHIYGDPDVMKRKHTWSLISTLRKQSQRPWFCIGDFNEILDHKEKEGGSIRPNWQMRDFRRALADNGLHDLGYLGEPFTWSNRQDHPATVRERLDRACASDSWLSCHLDAVIRHLNTIYSDHCPILLKSDP
ncbi:UNVERIFIED_CONTAM: hypothetical protein Sradi_0464700 [Sesamum radiatum]|uniref:Endonuclease/exonuclease/phosphatase domain-containing protein n=1 Tax=Sesamum radiatum TaxID=300843 RepID=A0AAW2W828_SESRA